MILHLGWTLRYLKENMPKKPSEANISHFPPRGTPCLTGFGSDVIFLVSQTVVALPDTIKTRPRYQGWHRTLIIYSLHRRS